jgi:hypothetical protein
MPRPKSERHSSDLAAEIARLEQERKRSIQSEDQRRGAIIRELLAGPASNSLQSTLQPLIAGRDAFLFGVEATNNGAKQPGRRSRASTARPVVESASRQSIEVAHSA